MLPEAELLARIGVRPPYFALRHVRRAGTSLEALVRTEQPLGREVGPISAGEAGRHLAILGACAAALSDEQEGQRYFLAHRAEIRRHGPLDGRVGRGPELVARMEGRSPRASKAHASGTLRSAEGEALYALDVRYHALSERAFGRLFRAHERDLRRQPRATQPEADELERLLRRRHNPYTQSHRLYELEVDGDSCRASVGRISEVLCKGHFARYPALPVAILMYSLTRLVEEWLVRRIGPGARYAVTHASVAADNLAFVGDEVRLRAHLVAARDGAHVFRCDAEAREGVPVGGMDLTLQLV